MTQHNDSKSSHTKAYYSSNSFKSFFVKVFHMLNPGVEFCDNWHLDLIIEYLKSVEESEVKRLIINVPPRSLKSTLISVAWAAWLMGNDSKKKIIVASYAQNLSTKHSIDCKAILSSSWFQKMFPNFKLMKGAITKNKFITSEHGFRFATSVKGTLTGEGADVIIVDDPHSAGQVASYTQRNASINWFDQTLSTRLNNKKKGVIVVIMQRLHKDDLTSHLLKKKTWNHLKIPAVADDDYVFRIRDKKFRFRTGEMLHSAREGEEEIDIAKNELGSFAFNAQYMQSPLSSENALIKRSWIQRYDQISRGDSLIVQSWDCAYKINDNNDFSVCSTWCVVGNYFYLIDVYKDKLQFGELKNIVENMAIKFDASSILIEDKASGQSLIQELKRSTKLPIIAINPTKDKETRFISSLFFFESGKVFFPNNAHWLCELEEELFSFPNAKHDDQVDSITQFLNWIKGYGKTTRKIRIM